MHLPTQPSRQVDTFRWMNPYLDLLLMEETSCRQLKLHCECGYEWSTFEHHTRVQGISQRSRVTRETLASRSRAFVKLPLSGTVLVKFEFFLLSFISHVLLKYMKTLQSFEFSLSATSTRTDLFQNKKIQYIALLQKARNTSC